MPKRKTIDIGSFKLAAAALFAGLLAAFAAAQPLTVHAQEQKQEQKQEQNDHLIVPWRRIGPVALGMSGADLTRILGNPDAISPGTVEVYNWGTLTATLTQDNAWVTQLCSFAPEYATAEGIHTGSKDSDVAELLGKPKYARIHNGFWRFSYSDLYWPGMSVSVHLKGYATNHSVWKICVNHFAAITE